MTKSIKPLPRKKTSRNKKKHRKGKLMTLFFLKKYGYFGKRKTRRKILIERFRLKYLKDLEKKFLPKRGIFEIMEEKRKEDAFIHNISLSRAWGQVSKSFFFKKTFNSYLGWSNSRIYNFQQKLGEIV